MKRRSNQGLYGSNSGAVAPTIALSLFALIAAGGIAFDYARMASMDTELQNAADQAALAAASQLDGKTGACARAAAAAANMVANLTLMANDGSTTAITVASEPACDAAGNVRFYQDKAKTQAANSDATARFVEVTVDPRTAFYTLTPIVAAFSSGPIAATAFAGLGEAICRVPPLMMCNPDETNDPDFTIANYLGDGLRLIANDGGGNYGPGNFGFLDVGQGANSLRAVLGRNGDPGDCVAGSTVTSETGNMITLRDALNTRFDMYDNGLNQACGQNNDLCPPSRNSRKDLFQRGSGNNACTFATGNQPGWTFDASKAYPPAALTTERNLTEAEIDALGPMGYPRDICHAVSVTGTCAGGIIGDGNWDRYAYFRSHRGLNYQVEGQSIATMNAHLLAKFGTTSPTRYQIYTDEMMNWAARLQAVNMGGGLTAHGIPVCQPPGITPGPNQIDRRVLSVAVINCAAEGVAGKTHNINVTRFVDIFLVEPTVPRDRTEIHDVYVEVIGETGNMTDGGAIQAVRKSVPYLIE